MCGSLCEPYWLVTVSGFQGSSCGGFPCISCGFARRVPPIRVRRQGDTLRTRVCRVNRFLGTFFRLSFGRARRCRSGKQKRLPMRLGRRSQAAMPHRGTAAPSLLCDRLPATLSFQHALRSPVSTPAVRRRNVPAAAPRMQGYFARARSRYPRFGTPTTGRAARARALPRRSRTRPTRRRPAARTGAFRPAAHGPQRARARTYIRAASSGSPSSRTPPSSIMRRPSPADATRPSSCSSAGQVDLVVAGRRRPRGRPPAPGAA